MHLPFPGPLRRAFLFGLEHAGPGDIVIRHHWTHDRVVLHSFKHKGYWYYGKERERDTMLAFERLVPSDAIVYDVGGHIGYTALFFASLAQDGRVFVFEPAANNLPYIRMNVSNSPNVTLVQRGVATSSGTLTLHIEDLTGQNNSFLDRYDVLADNETRATRVASVQKVEVPVVSLDDFAAECGSPPEFVKIDVEGFELEALRGSVALLGSDRPPVWMVEVTRRADEVVRLVEEHGYLSFNPDGTPSVAGSPRSPNLFFIHPDHHAARARAAGFQL